MISQVNVEKKIFYRYEEFMEGGDRLIIQEIHFEEMRETPKGWWIKRIGSLFFNGKCYWISKTSTKRRAYPTREEALNSFMIRKKRHKEYSLCRAQVAERAFDVAQRMLEELKTGKLPEKDFHYEF